MFVPQFNSSQGKVRENSPWSNDEAAAKSNLNVWSVERNNTIKWMKICEDKQKNNSSQCQSKWSKIFDLNAIEGWRWGLTNQKREERTTMMMQSQKQIIGLSFLISFLISVSRCNDIINVGWVSHLHFIKNYIHEYSSKHWGEQKV